MLRAACAVSLVACLVPSAARADGDISALRPLVARNTQMASSLPASISGYDQDFPRPTWDATVTPSLVVAGRTVATLDPIHVPGVTGRPQPFAVTVPNEVVGAVRQAASKHRTRRVVLHWSVEATEFTQDPDFTLAPRAVADRADDALTLAAPRRASRVRVGGAVLDVPPGWLLTSPSGSRKTTFLASYAGSCRADVSVFDDGLAQMRALTRDQLIHRGLLAFFAVGRGTVSSTRAWSTLPDTDAIRAAGLVRVKARRYAEVVVEAARYPSCPAPFDDEPALTGVIDQLVRALEPAGR